MKIYKVKSETNPEVFYEVRYFSEGGRFVCTCPAHAFGKVGFECKHIIKTKKYLAQKGKTTVPESPIEPPLPEKPPEKKLIIKTKNRYKEVKIEARKLSKEIGENWFVREKVKIKDEITGKEKTVKELTLNKKYKKKIYKYQELVDDMLAYEIEHDLLPL